MIVVIQRVTSASVKVEDKMVSSIGNGMLILLGISNDDSRENVIKMTNKISKLRIFNDENDIMNKNVNEVNGEVLVVKNLNLKKVCNFSLTLSLITVIVLKFISARFVERRKESKELRGATLD